MTQAQGRYTTESSYKWWRKPLVLKMEGAKNEYILEAGNIIFPLSKKNVDMQNSSLFLNPRGTEMKFYITIFHRHLWRTGGTAGTVCIKEGSYTG